jgi:hypothetical protein
LGWWKNTEARCGISNLDGGTQILGKEEVVYYLDNLFLHIDELCLHHFDTVIGIVDFKWLLDQD